MVFLYLRRRIQKKHHPTPEMKYMIQEPLYDGSQVQCLAGRIDSSCKFADSSMLIFRRARLGSRGATNAA